MIENFFMTRLIKCLIKNLIKQGPFYVITEKLNY